MGLSVLPGAWYIVGAQVKCLGEVSGGIAHQGKEAEDGLLLCEESTYCVLGPVLGNLDLSHLVFTTDVQGGFYSLCSMVKFRKVQGYPGCEPEFTFRPSQCQRPSSRCCAVGAASSPEGTKKTHVKNRQELAWPSNPGRAPPV